MFFPFNKNWVILFNSHKSREYNYLILLLWRFFHNIFLSFLYWMFLDVRLLLFFSFSPGGKNVAGNVFCVY